IAGVDPRFGLYSAIVVTLVASIFGSSSHLINGPTNAISLVVFSALAFFDPEARFDAYQGMFLLGIMVGSIQILIAVFKLGDLTRYISESVVLGFMAGAGFLVALGQVGNLVGLRDQGTGHMHVLYRFWLTMTQQARVSPHAVEIGVGTIILAVALAVSVAILSVFLFRSHGRAPTPIRSLAVLPLENLSGDASQKYFSDGMTDQLITDLAQISALKVISRTSVMVYEGARKPLPQTWLMTNAVLSCGTPAFIAAWRAVSSCWI
ncbi:MAG: SulP family inorganic anion transporter, partial [Edaphobacter sp.]